MTGVALLATFFVLIVGRQLRNVLHQIKALHGHKSGGRENESVLCLDSPELGEVRRVLFTVNDHIEVHPRQIRRILRRSLDSNIVEEIAVCRPLLHLKSPVFRRRVDEYRLECNAVRSDQSAQSDTVRFAFYFGASKSYLSQIESLTKKAAALRAKRSRRANGMSGIAPNGPFKLPWKSLFDSEQRASPKSAASSVDGDAEQIELERVRSRSSSVGGDGDAVSGIELTEMSGVTGRRPSERGIIDQFTDSQ